jgi:hypothetical protein
VGSNQDASCNAEYSTFSAKASSCN